MPEPRNAVTVSIRPARAGELDAIAALLEAAYVPYREGFPAVIFQRYLADVMDVRARFTQGELLVAERGGRLAGTITFYPDASREYPEASREALGFPGGWAGFRAIGVHPEARGLGLGRLLSEHAVARAREAGAPVIGIHTQPRLVEACRIYERMGFRRCPEFDFSAADALRLDPAGGDLRVLAYRLDL